MGSWLRWWFAAAAIAVGGCGSGSVSSDTPAPALSPAADQQSSEPTAAVPPTPTSPAAAVNLLDLPADTLVSFGGVSFELVTAETSTEDPVSRAQGLGLPSTSRYLYVEIGVDNATEFSTLTINERTFLSLSTPAGVLTTELESKDFSPASVIRPDVTGTYTAVFEIPMDFTPRDASLIFGEPNSHQLTLPLGDVDPDAGTIPRFPRVGSLELGGEVAGASSCGDSRLAASIASVVVSLDLPADITRSGGLPRRAALGTVFVELTTNFVALDPGSDDASCLTSGVTDDLVRLSAGGTEIVDRYVEGPANVELLSDQEATLIVGFMVPIDAALAVTLGNTAGRTITADFQVDDI